MAPLSQCQPSFRNAKTLWDWDIWFSKYSIVISATSTARVRKQDTNFCLSPSNNTWDRCCLLIDVPKLVSHYKKQLTWLMTGSCSLTRSWIGCGAMFSPPAVMIRSFSLPTIAWKPSLSIDTKSPDLGEGLLEMQDKYWELTSASHPRSCPS